MARRCTSGTAPFRAARSDRARKGLTPSDPARGAGAGARSAYHDDKSAAAMYDAVNNIGFDLWKATANGDTRVYDIRVTREQARMYSVRPRRRGRRKDEERGADAHARRRRRRRAPLRPPNAQHMFRDCAVIVPDVEQFIAKMEAAAPQVRARLQFLGVVARLSPARPG